MRAISLLFHDVYRDDPRESGFRSDAADRYKLPVADVEAQLTGIARARQDVPAVATSLAGAASNAVPYLLTADDGGVSYYTLLADRLDARGWRGHCFVATDRIGTPGFLDQAQIRELAARGHVIGSHTASHPARFSACDPDTMREEWSRSRMALEDLLGQEVAVASVPGGYYSRRVAEAARDAGLRVLFTSEPTTSAQTVHGLLVLGRFTLRRGHPASMAERLLHPYGWTRALEWARWNAKGVAKPVLGAAYPQIADWILRSRQGAAHVVRRD